VNLEQEINMEIPFVVNHQTFGDHRGNFCSVKTNMIYDQRLDKNWIQVNTSISVDPFTLRGLHFQVNGFEQSKYLKVVYGRIMNFVVCIDKSRPDFGSINIFDVDKDHAVMIPRGYANGLITLEPNTIIQYLVDNSYSPENEKSIYYASIPKLKVIVEAFSEIPIISDKDLNGVKWNDFISEKQ
jgi:dTDP-4-dehydrorhamnose 3,5-epimerase